MNYHIINEGAKAPFLPLLSSWQSQAAKPSEEGLGVVWTRATVYIEIAVVLASRW